MNETRNESIIELAAAGVHRYEVAGILGVTPRTVDGVLQRWRAGMRRTRSRPATFRTVRGANRIMDRVLSG